MFFLRFKMIVFKLLLAGLKKNLGLRYSKFYFREVKTKTRLEKRLYIIYFGPIQGVQIKSFINIKKNDNILVQY